MAWARLTNIRHDKDKARLGEQEDEEEVGGHIKEWTGLDFSETQRAADDRKKWRQLVSRSSVVPQQHYELRD